MLRHEKEMIDEQFEEVVLPLTCIIHCINNDMDYCDKYAMNPEVYSRLALIIPFKIDFIRLIIHHQHFKLQLVMIPSIPSPTPGTFSSTSLPIPTHCDP